MQFVWMGSAQNAGNKVGSILRNGVRPMEYTTVSHGPEYISKTGVRDIPVSVAPRNIPVRSANHDDDTWANWASNHPAAAEAHEVSLARSLQEDMNRAFVAKYGLPSSHHISFQNIPRMLWQAVTNSFGYIVFTYQDLYAQLINWNGSWVSLVKNVNLIWRLAVTSVITMGLIEIVPFFSSVSRLLMEIGEIIWSVAGLFMKGVDEIWGFLELLWQDMVIIVRRITG